MRLNRLPCSWGAAAACILAFGLGGCGGGGAAPEQLPDPEPTGGVLKPGPISGDRSQDDLARFYAGLPSSSGSLSTWEANSAWQSHASSFSRDWARAQRTHHGRARKWAASELRARIPATGTIYYLFGGADFVTAELLFPWAREVIMAGLEPVGSVPHPSSISGAQLGGALGNLRASFDGLLRSGFSETKKMRLHLNSTAPRGVKPMLYVSIARTGNRVLSSREFSVGGGRAVQINFSRGGGAPVRRLYYIQGDLSNGGSRALLSWLGNHGPAGSYLKAASYLMHRDSFSRVRNFLLKNSRFVLQDDSGIPFRSFDRGMWNLTLFGKYVGVMDIFNQYYQQDLRDAYKAPGAAVPISFGLGYRVRYDEAPLILAVRR